MPKIVPAEPGGFDWAKMDGPPVWEEPAPKVKDAAPERLLDSVVGVFEPDAPPNVMLGVAVAPPPPKTKGAEDWVPFSLLELLPKLNDGGAEVVPLVANGLLNDGCSAPPAVNVKEEDAPPNDWPLLGCVALC